MAHCVLARLPSLSWALLVGSTSILTYCKLVILLGSSIKKLEVLRIGLTV